MQTLPKIEETLIAVIKTLPIETHIPLVIIFPLPLRAECGLHYLGFD